tara:strand:+ start:482 stop:802 length:321 start_codon:yes stop_codon:yes gene_type:complete
MSTTARNASSFFVFPVVRFVVSLPSFAPTPVRTNPIRLDEHEEEDTEEEEEEEGGGANVTIPRLRMHKATARCIATTAARVDIGGGVMRACAWTFWGKKYLEGLFC